MCGIVGALSSRPLNRDLALRCLEQLRHRGPDENGMFLESNVFLGMTRLSIVDLESGSQPMWSENGYQCMVYNGELYNYLQLKAELQSFGHHFKTKCDTEVVLRAFEHWGPDCLNKFNGMFAFAVWDRRTGQLTLARDRIGEKPLYYYADADRFWFASEAKAILADDTVPRRIDPQGLTNFLTFGHSVGARTMFSGVCKLPPGHFLTVNGSCVQVSQYWDVGNGCGHDGSTPIATHAERVGAIRSLLEESVRMRLMADVPVGAFLSGGLDSSAIVSLMTRHASGPVKTFSLGFDVGGAYNELSGAAAVARALGTEHHELQVGGTDLVESLAALVHHYDEPFGDPAGFPVFLLSRLARRHVKVVLAGDGADELFGGYRRYAADALSSRYQVLPEWLTQAAAPALMESLPRLRRLKRASHTLGMRDPARRYASWLQVFNREQRAMLLTNGEAGAAHDPCEAYVELYSRRIGDGPPDHLNQLMYIDLKTWLADVYMEKTDKASMAASVEARLPFLDHRLVELAFATPGVEKIRGWSTKRILKEAVADLVPEGVVKARKHGFSVPLDPWFRGELSGFVSEILLDDRTRNRGYFDPAVVERMWREHVEGRRVWDNQLWLLLNFELWHRAYLDRSPDG